MKGFSAIFVLLPCFFPKPLMFLFALLLTHGLYAQDFNRYQPLECSGKLPEDFRLSASTKYSRDLQTIAIKDYKEHEEKARKAFALESNFTLDDFLKSGLVLFNDPISQYLNEVCAQVSKSVSTSKNIRVYALRSTVVNAFATDHDAIFVTLGLLAQLKNEAQLAYVLAHEIIHVLENHPVNLYLQTEEIERKPSPRFGFGSTTFNDKTLAKNRYSKELESTADAKGLELMLKTEYSTATLHTVFDVMKYSHLPFEEIAFERSFLETAALPFPPTYWLEKVNPIHGKDEAVEDSKSGHPNIGQRRAALAQTLQQKTGKGTKNFVLSEARFYTIQKIARFELPPLHLHRGELPEALYTAYLSQQDTPSLYLQKCVVKALYLHAKYLNDGKPTLKPRVDSIEGEIQQVYHFLKSLKGIEATVLALQKAWQLQQQAGEDPEVQDMVKDLFIEFAQYYSSLKDFAAPIKPYFLSNAFSGFIDEPAFKVAFAQGQNTYKQRREEQAASQPNAANAALGIPKVVLVNPFFLKMDEKKANPVQYLETESGQNHFKGLMRDMANQAELKATFLDVEELPENGTPQFNDIRMLNEWFAEQIQFSNLSLTPGLQQSRIAALASKYGTDYFLWTGAISLISENRNPWGSMAEGLSFWPQLPWAMVNAQNLKYDLLYYAILFDVKTMRRRVLKFEYLKYSDFETAVKAQSYDAFLQIRKKE